MPAASSIRSRLRRAPLGRVVLLALLMPHGAAPGVPATGADEGPARTARRDDAGVRGELGAPLPAASASGNRDLPETVILPDLGTYRAPRILRLAGRLTGLAVRVARGELNDVPIEIPRRLARRPIGLPELRLLLAAHSLYLHEWEHPEKGAMLVASSRRDWTPPVARARATVRVGRRSFDRVAERLRRESDRRNEHRPEGAVRYVVLPVPRAGKIWVWAPDRDGLESLVALATKLEPIDESARWRLRLFKVRTCKARRLVEPLLERLGEEDRAKARIAVGDWGNWIFVRAPDAVAERIVSRLEELDRPSFTSALVKKEARRHAGREWAGRSRPGPAEAAPGSPETSRNGSEERIDLLEGELPVREGLRFLSAEARLPLVVGATAPGALDASLPVPATIRGVCEETIRALLEAAGWRIERRRLPGGREVLEVSHGDPLGPRVPRSRRLRRAE